MAPRMTPDDPNIHASYRIQANRLFPGGGEAPLLDQIIEISDGVISRILPLADVRDAADGPAAFHHFEIVAPGFIDLQINGAGGAMFNDTPDMPTLACMAAAAGKGGTCHLLPTFITAPGTSYMAALDAVAAWDGPEILGIHLEGPFLSRKKPGIHPPDAIRPMTDDDVARLCAFAGGFAGRVMLTLAPEEATPAHLQQLHDAGIILFAGHTDASAQEMSRAVDHGLRGVTHLFNACSQITAREPGVVGAAFIDNRLVAGIIADGHHVDPDNLALAARLMSGRLCLVSDSMSSYGSTLDSFSVAGRQVSLIDGRLQADDGTLGGAHLGLDEAVRTMVTRAGVSLAEALDMASGIPANILGLADSHGRIEPGRPASLSCLDETLGACAVIVGGVLSANGSGADGS
ncbi:N-acetylglucosamine-6-phosphate deacetylase [Alphaproteobacteria bacterium LSUCC0719]